MKHRYTDEEKKEFGIRLTALLDERGVSQSDVARVIWGETRIDARGFSQVVGRDRLSVYCKGVCIPQPSTLRKLAEALSVEAHDLLPVNRYAGALRPPTQETPIRTFDISVLGVPAGFMRVQIDALMPISKATEITTLISKHAGR